MDAANPSTLLISCDCLAILPFQELIVSDGEKREFAATKASPEWFACFQTFFFKVNRQAGRMCGTTDGMSVHSSGQARDRPGGDPAEGMVLGKRF